MHVKHEPLQLIPPQFETPLPPLQPAVRALFYQRLKCLLVCVWGGGGGGVTTPQLMSNVSLWVSGPGSVTPNFMITVLGG